MKTCLYVSAKKQLFRQKGLQINADFFSFSFLLYAEWNICSIFASQLCKQHPLNKGERSINKYDK